MSHEFNREYRIFASAASRVGFERDERKLIGEDPNLILGVILESVDRVFKDKLSPEKLISFFDIVRGKSGVNARNVLDVGNFLYDYRADLDGGKTIHTLNETSIKFVNLACVLLEDAFYSGRLFKLKGEDAASLAFIVNVLAKILKENSSDGLMGFSKTSLETLIEKVSEEEKSRLFPDEIEVDRTITEEEQIRVMKAKIDYILRQAIGVREQIDWQEYFEGLDARLDHAMNVLLQAGLNYRGLQEVIDALKKYKKSILNYYKVFEFLVKEDKIIDYQKYKTLFQSQVDVLEEFLVGNSRDFNIREEITNDFISATAGYNQINRDAQSTVIDKPVTLDSFDALSKVHGLRSLPEAIATLSEFFDKESKGPFGEYIQYLRELYKLKKATSFAEKRFAAFKLSREHTLSRIEFPETPAYFFKTCLIVNDMITRNVLAPQSVVKDGRFDLSVTPSHSFLDGSINDGRPAYADLHYLPEDIIFAKAAVNLIRKQHNI